MVGGKVVETVILRNAVWVNVYSADEKDSCAVYVVRNSASEYIAPGDKLWWQGGVVYWTPAEGGIVEHAIDRIGCSGVRRPSQELIETGFQEKP